MEGIKVIIFDLGGVVFENGSQKTIDYLINNYHLDEKFARRLISGKEALDLRAGKMSPKKFWQFVDSILPKRADLTAQKLHSLWYNFYLPHLGIFQLLEKLHQNYRLGILSGNVKDRIEFLDDKYHFRQYFDFEVFSFNEGLNKPDLRLYQKALALTKSPAQNCLYIDNTPRDLEPAQKLGLKTILFENIVQLKTNLQKLGILV